MGMKQETPDQDPWRKQAVRKGGVLKCPDAIAEGYGWRDEVLPVEMVNMWGGGR
jgi:hypothetical protein